MTDFKPPSEFSTAVLFVIFNRPETARVVFDAIRRAKPPRLYVCADGPRRQIPGEQLRCDEARAIIKSVDWPCEVHTLFRDVNLGCGKALFSGITWFFDHETEGIVLEDDCLPSPSFFGYCEELLSKYRNDTRVMHIGGNNFLRGWNHNDSVSYYFSLNGHVWGWASWSRAWKKYDFFISKFNTMNEMGYFKRFFLNIAERYYRMRKFKQVIASSLDTWDYQWDFARFINSGLAIVPVKNLVKNIGYGTGATHTKEGNHEYGNLEVNDLQLPLSHPGNVFRDRVSDEKYFRVLMSERILSKLR